MKIKTICRLLFIGILCFMATAFACNDSGGNSAKSNECDVDRGNSRPAYCKFSIDIPWSGSPSVNDHIIKTPAGITIRSVVDVPIEAQLAADQAFARVIEHTRAAHPEWQNYKSPLDNQIVLVDPDHFTAETDPGAGVVNVWYTASGDQHNPNRQKISSADTCYGCPGFFYPPLSAQGIYLMAVVPDQAKVDPLHSDQAPWSHLQFFRESIYNSFEHVQECGNDMNVCLQFATAGDQHPHWGDDIWSDPLPVVTASLKKSKSLRSGSPCYKPEDCKPSSLVSIPQVAPSNKQQPLPNKGVK